MEHGPVDGGVQFCASGWFAETAFGCAEAGARGGEGGARAWGITGG